MAEPTKLGMLYVFDRISGKPVWPIPEKPVPAGDVPGEWYAPTQPMLFQALRLMRAPASAKDELIDFTLALRAEALDLVMVYRPG